MAPRKKAKKSQEATAPAGTTGGDPATAGKAVDNPSSTAQGASSGPPGRRALRGRRGGLKDMPNMPLDILIEIFSHMHPRDLLNLSRTSKHFRAFLMSRSSSALYWKAARKQVAGLPDCPPFLSEPQYANLLFFPYCHNCLKPNIKTIIWEVYARYCQACKEELFQPGRYLQWNFYLEVRKATNVVHFEFTTLQLPKTKSSIYDADFIHMPEVMRFKDKWETLMTTEEKVQWAKEHMDAVQQRMEPIDALKAWKAAETDVRSAELDAMKQARFASVVARLRQEGWSDELEKMSEYRCFQLKKHKAVYKAQKLTNAGWQAIRGDLTAHMESVRQSRLISEQHALYCKRLNIFYGVFAAYEATLARRTVASECRASFVDILEFPPLRELIRAPGTTDVTLQDFTELKDTIPGLMARWFEERKAEFVALVQDLVRADVDPVPLLSLAIITFQCSVCKRADLRWPYVLAHRCSREHDFSFDPYLRAISETCAQKKVARAWRGAGMFSLVEHLDVPRAVVAACGLNPDTSTHEDMDQLDARLVCMACTYQMEIPCTIALDWEQAVTHKRPEDGSVDDEDCNGPSQWKMLDPDLTTQVRALEKGTDAKLANFEPSIFRIDPLRCCTRCSYRTRDGIIAHCQKQHDVEAPQLSEDFYQHPDYRESHSNISIFPEKFAPAPGASHPRSRHSGGLHSIYTSVLFE